MPVKTAAEQEDDATGWVPHRLTVEGVEQAGAVPCGRRRKTSSLHSGGGSRGLRGMCGLNRKGVPLEDTATLLVCADSVCTRRGDTSNSARVERLMTAFPGQRTQQQASTIETARALSHAVSRGP